MSTRPEVDQVLRDFPETLSQMRRLDRNWLALRNGESSPASEFIQNSSVPLDHVPFDVVVCGGTLGIVLAATLVDQGWRVLLLERGELRGRQQEWNISRDELKVLVDLDLMTAQQLEQVIVSEFNPLRVQFHRHPPIWVRDVLNIGVDPVGLLEILKDRFCRAGGQLVEHSPCQRITLHSNGVTVHTTTGAYSGRLLLDAMGHGSPIVAQARSGQRPQSVCLVVGTCAQGYPHQQTGDLLVSHAPIQNHSQYFWEAFPARDGRTTYLFTYADLDLRRPSLKQLFSDYFLQLPNYQGVDLEALNIQRALCGLFPSYRDSPLPLPWPRMLAIGDSSGNQSPLSFGGFGAMMRHLHRLWTGIDEALRANCLQHADLARIYPYQPSLSATGLFQQSMQAPLAPGVQPQAINDLLALFFNEMVALGDPVLKPFLQDVVRFPGLAQTLWRVTRRYPQRIPALVAQLGPVAIADWLPHFVSLGLYHQLHHTAPGLREWILRLPPRQQYQWHRRLEGWTYGSGND